jgi:hypothetical protein
MIRNWISFVAGHNSIAHDVTSLLTPRAVQCTRIIFAAYA